MLNVALLLHAVVLWLVWLDPAFFNEHLYLYIFVLLLSFTIWSDGGLSS